MSLIRPEMQRLVLQVVALAVFGVFSTACSDPVDFNTVIKTARVVVQVTDTAGSPVPNVPVMLLLAENGTLWRTGRTGSDGKGEIAPQDGGVLWGDYLLRVVPPAGYVVDPRRPHPLPLRVEGNLVSRELVLVRQSR